MIRRSCNAVRCKPVRKREKLAKGCLGQRSLQPLLYFVFWISIFHREIVFLFPFFPFSPLSFLLKTSGPTHFTHRPVPLALSLSLSLSLSHFNFNSNSFSEQLGLKLKATHSVGISISKNSDSFSLEGSSPRNGV